MLIRHKINDFELINGSKFEPSDVTYQIFGQDIKTAPVVLIIHALTGNSDVISPEKGWWKTLVGQGKTIDTDKYSVIAFNIPGNGYDGNLIEECENYTAKDIARLFIKVLEEIEVKKLYAAVGGSLGGGIAWEMAALLPDYIDYLIPVAADWKSTDWIIGHNYIQKQILNNSKLALQDARMMAMLFYRTPESFTEKFQRTKTSDNKMFNVESWLKHHGVKLEGRFDIRAYKMMNHLLTTIDITRETGSFELSVKDIKSTIIQIYIDSDLFFSPQETMKTKLILDKLNKKNYICTVNSKHGHDGFLIEFDQISNGLKDFF